MNSEGIYFFHIPKTAGVSLHHFIDNAFPAEDIYGGWLWDHLIIVPRAELGKWRVFRGHFLSHLEPYLERKLRTFTLLRDPVARTISHYYHVRRSPDHPFHGHAQRLSLAEFCVHPETRHMIENYQANYLAKAPRDVAAVARDLSPEQLARYELQERLQAPDTFATSASLLECAQGRLATFEIVGITENFDKSVLEISRKLNCPAPESSERRNVNPMPVSNTDLDPSTLAVIHKVTEVDRRLYQSALDSQQATTTSSPDSGIAARPIVERFVARFLTPRRG